MEKKPSKGNQFGDKMPKKDKKDSSTINKKQKESPKKKEGRKPAKKK